MVIEQVLKKMSELVLEQKSARFNVEEFARRKKLYTEVAELILRMVEDYSQCTHKYPDGTDARYSVAGGEMHCVCGNRWD